MTQTSRALALGAAIACGTVLAAQDARVKPAIRGLVSMGAYKFVGAGGEPANTLEPLQAKPGIFGGLVVVASWAQLQPDGPTALADGNVIDTAMADVRAYNAKHPDKPLALRLRVWGGFMAPPSVLGLGGRPIEAVHKEKKRRLGRFWSPSTAGPGPGCRRSWPRSTTRFRSPRGVGDVVQPAPRLRSAGRTAPR
jgi:hypothetical protein